MTLIDVIIDPYLWLRAAWLADMQLGCPMANPRLRVQQTLFQRNGASDADRHLPGTDKSGRGAETFLLLDKLEAFAGLMGQHVDELLYHRAPGCRCHEDAACCGTVALSHTPLTALFADRNCHPPLANSIFGTCQYTVASL